VPASYAIFVVKEREGVRGDGGPKHQQLLSGVSIPAYWFSTWAFDNLTYIIPGGLAILLCYAFQVRGGGGQRAVAAAAAATLGGGSGPAPDEVELA
jgi:ATP-binding cassette subfamily A (ABC1) protein 3